MTKPLKALTPDERIVFEAEWSYVVLRARYLAALLGFPNPFPTRQKRRDQRRIDEAET